MIRFLAAACLLGLSIFPARAVEFIWGITGAHSSGSSLYQINASTGAVIALVGSTGANALAGISIHPTTRTLYAANGAAAPTGLFTLSKTTGAATLIGSSGKVVPSMGFDSAGVLYAWDQVGKKLMTLSLSTGAATVLNGNVMPSGTGLTFGPTGLLYLKNNNSLYTLNKATGLKATGPLTLTPGGAVSLDNLLVFNSAGTLYSGARTPSATPAATTAIYVVNPVTGTATLAFTIPLAITGFVFDDAAAPTVAVKGKKKIKTTKSSVTIKGSATSVLPLTVTAPKSKPAKAVRGAWTLKVKVKRGKNVVKINCVDPFGQVATAKVTVVRD